MIRRLTLAFTFLLFTASAACAQIVVSGFAGTLFNTPDLVICSITTGCGEEGRRTYGFSVGYLGKLVGEEFELAYTNGFYGSALGSSSSSLTTMMGNVMLAPKIGFVQPYGLAGFGVMRLRLQYAFGEADDATVAWSAGAGIFVFPGRHVGIRGDIRQFWDHNLEQLRATLEGSNLRFTRASAALVLKF